MRGESEESSNREEIGVCDMTTSDTAMTYWSTNQTPEHRDRHPVAAPALPLMHDWTSRDADGREMRREMHRGEKPQLPLKKAQEHTTVLVVDDETSIAHLLEELLESAGYHVLVAYSGREGLELARSERPALILTDCMMPGLDGPEFVRRVRSSAVTNTIPVVMMSSVRPRSVSRDGIAGLGTPETRIVRTVPQGVYFASIGDVRLPFIEKPFDLDVVLRVVETAVAAGGD